MTLNDLPDVITPQQVADILHISRRTVYSLLDLKPEAGGIPSFRVGERTRRINKQAFLRWMDQQK
jgi:excisionase family DNA binding protein